MMRGMDALIDLDAIDRRILAALQRDGRMTYDELAGAVGLSASAVLRRVRRLEAAGVITGYAALVAAERIGLGLCAYISVRLDKRASPAQRTPGEAFRAAVQVWPEVVECVALAGEMDYLLCVVVADMPHYARFVNEALLRHPAVQDVRTSFVLDRVKAGRVLPV
jgi:Lrp/AsnC family leucine-responsive transcriptional regulator